MNKIRLTYFHDAVSYIAAHRWEKTLPIGRFKYIHIGNVIRRPFSLVAKCRVIGDAGEKSIFIKIYTEYYNADQEMLKEKVKVDFDKIMWWYNIFSDSNKFNVVKPIVAISDKCILVTEESPGESLYDVITKSAHFLAGRNLKRSLKAFYNVGGWLRYKNERVGDGTSVCSIDDLIDYIQVRIDILTSDPRRNFPKGYAKKILEFYARNKREISRRELSSVISHNDFNPGNILVDDNTVTVLDFGRSVEDSYLLDLSKLYYQLNLFAFKPQYAQFKIKRLQKALLQGFGESDADQLMMFRFMLIRNTLTHLVNITQFWKHTLKEKGYNRWVLSKELSILDRLIRQ